VTEVANGNQQAPNMDELICALKNVRDVTNALRCCSDLAVRHGPMNPTSVRNSDTGLACSFSNLALVLETAKDIIDALVLMRTAIHALGIDADGNLPMPENTDNVTMLAPYRYAQADRFFDGDDDGDGCGPDAA